MHLPLALDILGLSEGQIAILISGVALIFALRRWRLTTVRNRAAGANPAIVSPDESPVPNPLSTREFHAEPTALLADLEENTRRVAAQISNRRTGL